MEKEVQSSPFSNYQEFPPDVLERMRDEAVASGDTNMLELILEEAQNRDRSDDTEPVYGHLAQDCEDNLHMFGVI